MEPTSDQPAHQISPAKAFGLLLETACEDFENLQDLITGDLIISCSTAAASRLNDRRKSLRVVRTGATIKMALAKSFVFSVRRANRVCNLNRAELGIDRTQRKAFLKATEPIIAVRDINEHGFDGNGSSKPSMHENEGGMLDETSLAVFGPKQILMGPLNLYELYVAVNEMRNIAGLTATSLKRNPARQFTDPPLDAPKDSA
jgi:hypothetical protein